MKMSKHRYYGLQILMMLVFMFYPLKTSSQLFTFINQTTPLECYFDCYVKNCLNTIIIDHDVAYGGVPYPECTFAGVSDGFAAGGVIFGMVLGVIIPGTLTGYYATLLYQKYVRKKGAQALIINENSSILT